MGGVSTGQHISEVANALRTLFLKIRTLKGDPVLLRFFDLRESALPRLVSTSEVYGNITYGPLKGVPLTGLVSDHWQQSALIGNKCLIQAKPNLHMGLARSCCSARAPISCTVIMNYLVRCVTVWFERCRR